MTDDAGWEGETRRIGVELARATTSATTSSSFTYLVAGPPAMVEGDGETLEQAGIPEEQVHAGALQRLLIRRAA